MSRIFQEQRQVVKDFARHLGLFVNGRDGGQEAKAHYREATYYDVPEPHQSKGENGPSYDAPSHDAKHHAAVLLELIESRQAEIQDLEGSIVRTSQRVCSYPFHVKCNTGTHQLTVREI